MQNLITTPADYWIAPNAVNITLNALGDKNRIQCGVASGAVIMCFIDEIRAEGTPGGEDGNGDGLWYGTNHEPRRWPLGISPTYFNSDTRKYVYAAIPRSTQVGTQALIVFPSELLDIYGRQAAVSDVSPSESSSSSSDDTPAQIGSTDFFYVYLGGIISAVETVNSTEQRRWETRITDWGTLETPQGRDESFNKYTFWGQSINANNQVTGHLAGSINYIEFANGVRLGVDTADNTLKVYMQNNQQAHLFSTGAVSAFGPSALGGGGGDLILGPLLSALNAEPMPTDDGYLHWTGSAFEWVEPGGGGEMPSTVAWNNITGKPSTFQPSAHTHLKEDITDFAHAHDDRYYTESEIDGFLAAKLAKPSQGTYTKLTVASGGGVTWGTLSASDIPSITKSKISDFPTTWAWSAITGKPTTLADYGITDAATAAQMTAATGRISTLEGYFSGGVAKSAQRLSGSNTYYVWGQEFWKNGAPTGNVNGDIAVDEHYMITFWVDSYIHADDDDWLHLHGNNGIMLDGITSIDGFDIENDSGRLRLAGNVYATGALSCLGTSATGSNSGALSLLTDVNISGTPTNGYVLTYDSTSGKWTPQPTQATDLSAYATRQWVEQNWLVKNALATQPAAPPAVNPGEPQRSYKLVVTDVSLSSGTLLFTKDYIKDTFAKADIVDFAHTHSTQDIDGLSNYALSSEVSQLRIDIGSFVGSLSFSGDYMEVGTKDAREGYMGTISELLVPFATTTMGFKRLNKEAAGTWDANTMTVGGVQYALLTNYRSTSEWSNMPSGMSWGGVLQITAGSGAGVLSGQLAWDSNHNVTTGVTRKLYWRSRNSTGWGTNDWHTIAYEDWATSQLNTLGDNLQSYVTTQLAGYLPLTAGSSKPLTGNIAYKGTKATKEMITFIDNKSDQWGNGIAVGGGGATIIGGGESAVTMIGQLPNVTVDGVEYINGGSEVMYIGNDTSVSIFTNLGTASGWANRKEFVFTTEGNLFLPKRSDNGCLWLSSIGAMNFNAGTGGWATQFMALNTSAAANLGGCGMLGENNSLTYFYIGQAYNNTWAVVKPNGNVGIGTTSPSCKLDVNGIAKANYVLFKNYNDNSNAGYCGRGNSSSNDIFLMSYAANVHIGANSSSNDIYIDTSHNVGIGTASTSYKLDVNGAAHLSGDNSNYGIILANNKALGFTDSSGANVKAFYLNDKNYLSLGWNTALKGYNTGIYGSTLVFGTGMSTNEAARITAAGNVGIGTDNPQHKLHVAGNVVATGAVSALGVSSQGTAVGAVVADTLTVNQTATVSGGLTVEGLANFNDYILLDNHTTIFWGDTAGDAPAIYMSNGHIYARAGGGNTVQIV